MIVPFAAGGTSDVIARVVAEEMTKSLGQPIVIENVAGAGGSTALTRAARAEADGYTIAIGNAGTSAATYTIYPKLPFTPESFVPIAVVAKTFGIVALRKDFPAKNLQDFIAYAKKNPGKVNLGHAGVGSSNFLICKSFVQAAGIDVTLVGYRGAAPALTDAIGGQIDGVCDSAASVSQAIDDKLVRGLVVGSTVRLATLPDLPTSAEAGLPEFEAQGWNGLFAPKGTPPAIIAKLNAAAKTAVESEAVKKRFHDLSTVAPDANELTPEVLPTGDARRREIQEAAGREEVAPGDPVAMKKPRQCGAFCYRPVIYLPGVEPGAAGVNVEPLGEGLRSVFPDGFSPLFWPAAALPALLVMPVPAAPPVALLVVVPLVEDPSSCRSLPRHPWSNFRLRSRHWTARARECP